MTPEKKISIKVHDRETGKVIHDGEVYAVGGEEGVFGIFEKDDMIYFVAGDDGNWWVSSSYSKLWLKQIFSAIYGFFVDAQINEIRKDATKHVQTTIQVAKSHCARRSADE